MLRSGLVSGTLGSNVNRPVEGIETYTTLTIDDAIDMFQRKSTR